VDYCSRKVWAFGEVAYRIDFGTDPLPYRSWMRIVIRNYLFQFFYCGIGHFYILRPMRIRLRVPGLFSFKTFGLQRPRVPCYVHRYNVQCIKISVDICRFTDTRLYSNKLMLLHHKQKARNLISMTGLLRQFLMFNFQHLVHVYFVADPGRKPCSN